MRKETRLYISNDCTQVKKKKKSAQGKEKSIERKKDMLIVVMFEYKIVDYFFLYFQIIQIFMSICVLVWGWPNEPGLRTGRQGQFEEDLVQRDDWKGRGWQSL